MILGRKGVGSLFLMAEPDASVRILDKPGPFGPWCAAELPPLRRLGDELRGGTVSASGALDPDADLLRRAALLAGMPAFGLSPGAGTISCI
jgi:hypothetical protein